MLSVEIETYSCLPCRTERFVINGIDASVGDFWAMDDTDWRNAEPYGCGCMEFIPDETCMKDAVKKYNITEAEFLRFSISLWKCCMLAVAAGVFDVTEVLS